MSDPEERCDTKMEISEEPTKIIFKHKSKRNIRQRMKSENSDEDDNAEVRPKLANLKEIQSLRKRPNGVSIVGLALGTKVTAEDEAISKDPFKINAGGMVNMQALKSGKMKQVEDAYDTGIGTQFSVETNKRDEDEEMMKYIEDQLAKTKGGNSDCMDETKKIKYCSPEEAALQAVPIHLRESSTQRSEEMLSNQMLSGIPEVDLGIEAKIKNIEATEEAKLKLLRESMNKKDGPSQFVPSNMAVNFIQQNRFNVEPELPKKITKIEPIIEVVPGNKISRTKKDEKATDDFHYEKFKKQFRRY